MVIAAAGSGKTLTISAKVKYLVEQKGIKPEEILLISFTNKAAAEMQSRIAKKLNVNVECKTFHKLGLDILASYSEEKPSIYSEGMSEKINEYLKNEIYGKKDELKKLLEFFGYYLNIPKDWSKFESLGEYYDHCQKVDLETLKSKNDQQRYINKELAHTKKTLRAIAGEKVKSLEELSIANFLFLNGVEYEYERPYEHNVADKEHSKYKPDFYLKESGIYLEHFGINEDFRAPQYSEIEEEKYIAGIKWKRELHEKYDTKMIETYSYYSKDGLLLTKLEEVLKEANIKFKEVDFSKIFRTIFGNNNNAFAEFTKLINSFISLAKANRLKPEALDVIKNEKQLNKFMEKRVEIFIDLVKPIYRYYEEFLQEANLIDFNDMISKAVDIVKAGELSLNYKYVIIDEFQDIAVNRYNLVKEIVNKTGAKTFCVGDDFQSIYRFTGSDLSMFTDFGKFFGEYQQLKIEKTYRNSQELIDVAGSFILKNDRQINKNLKSDKSKKNPIKLMMYERDETVAFIGSVDRIVDKYGAESEIMVIGRNNFDIDGIVSGNSFFSSKFDRENNVKRIQYNRYPNLDIKYITAHSSKGMEAKNTILINLKNSLLGFPNKISDDPLLSYILTEPDNYDYAEERRLFYVALTRTKNDVYLLSPSNKSSDFVQELVDMNDSNIEIIDDFKGSKNDVKCPRCKEGTLVTRKGQYGKNFVGCSNYPLCDYTYSNTDILFNKKICPECGGFLSLKRGKYGSFWGCSNYPYCKYTMNKKN